MLLTLSVTMQHQSVRESSAYYTTIVIISGVFPDQTFKSYFLEKIIRLKCFMYRNTVVIKAYKFEIYANELLLAILSLNINRHLNDFI